MAVKSVLTGTSRWVLCACTSIDVLCTFINMRVAIEWRWRRRKKMPRRQAQQIFIFRPFFHSFCMCKPWPHPLLCSAQRYDVCSMWVVSVCTNGAAAATATAHQTCHENYVTFSYLFSYTYSNRILSAWLWLYPWAWVCMGIEDFLFLLLLSFCYENM